MQDAALLPAQIAVLPTFQDTGIGFQDSRRALSLFECRGRARMQ